MMRDFSFRGTIADLDETVEGESGHPALVLVLETGDNFIRVIIPDDVLAGRRRLLAMERCVEVTGEVRASPYGPVHLATELQLAAWH